MALFVIIGIVITMFLLWVFYLIRNTDASNYPPLGQTELDEMKKN